MILTTRLGERIDCASDQPASKDSEVDSIIDVYPEDSKEYPDSSSEDKIKHLSRSSTRWEAKAEVVSETLDRAKWSFGQHQGLQRKSLLVVTYLINAQYSGNIAQYSGNIAIAMKYLGQELGGCLLEKIWPNFGMSRRIIGIPKKPYTYFWISCE